MGICANTNTHGQIAAYSPRLLLFLVTAKSNTFICYYLVCSRHWLKSAQIISEKNGQCVAIQVGTDKSDSLRDRSRPDVVDSIVSRRSSFLLPHPFHNCCCLFLFFCTSFRFLQYARCSLLNFCLLQHSTRQRAFHIHKTLSQTNVRAHTYTLKKNLFQIRLSVDFPDVTLLCFHTTNSRKGYCWLPGFLTRERQILFHLGPNLTGDNSHSPTFRYDIPILLYTHGRIKLFLNVLDF